MAREWYRRSGTNFELGAILSPRLTLHYPNLFQAPDLLSAELDADGDRGETPLEPPKVSKIQANMLTNRSGYADRFAGMAAAAELQGIRLARPRKTIYEDDDEEAEGDNIGLLGKF